jgi:hypothetical protein
MPRHSHARAGEPTSLAPYPSILGLTYLPWRITRWSSTSMSIIVPASTSVGVTYTSSGLGGPNR